MGIFSKIINLEALKIFKKFLMKSSDGSIDIENEENSPIDIKLAYNVIKSEDIDSATAMSKADYQNLSTKDTNKLYFLYEQQ